jgi:hypothetical protein
LWEGKIEIVLFEEIKREKKKTAIGGAWGTLRAVLCEVLIAYQGRVNDKH